VKLSLQYEEAESKVTGAKSKIFKKGDKPSKANRGNVLFRPMIQDALLVAMTAVMGTRRPKIRF